MQNENSEPLTVSRRGLLVTVGYGVRINVAGGHLEVSELWRGTRRTVRLNRVTSGLRRLVLTGHSGMVTLDAMRWLDQINADLVVLERDGRALLQSGPILIDRAALHHGQCLARYTATGLDIVRGLLDKLFEGRAQNASELLSAPELAAHIDDAREALRQCADVDELRRLEGATADAYWSWWENLPVQWPRSSRNPVPMHWEQFGRRISPLGKTGGPNRAISPAWSAFNYLTSIVKSEATLLCRAHDLDPRLAIMHATVGYHEALATDLMEPVRPALEAYWLRTVRERTQRPSDYLELGDGECRLSPALRKSLAETAPRWRALLSPLIEDVAQKLADLGAQWDGRPPQRLPNPLTQTARRRAHGAGPARLPELPRLPAACKECGVPTDGVYCEECRPRFVISDLGAARDKAQAARTARGDDPQHGGQAAVRRARAMASHHRASARWKAEAGSELPSPEEFWSEIWPGLAQFSTRTIAAAVGLSQTYCGSVKRGTSVLHPRHWPALRGLIDAG